MNEWIDDLTVLQIENMFKKSCSITRTPDDGRGLKTLLSASNDACFFVDLKSDKKFQTQKTIFEREKQLMQRGEKEIKR